MPGHPPWQPNTNPTDLPWEGASETSTHAVDWLAWLASRTLRAGSGHDPPPDQVYLAGRGRHRLSGPGRGTTGPGLCQRPDRAHRPAVGPSADGRLPTAARLLQPAHPQSRPWCSTGPTSPSSRSSTVATSPTTSQGQG